MAGVLMQLRKINRNTPLPFQIREENVKLYNKWADIPNYLLNKITSAQSFSIVTCFSGAYRCGGTKEQWEREVFGR